MSLATLYPLAGELPATRCDFAPAHAGNFAPPLARNEQQLIERAKWITQAVKGGPDDSNLVFVKVALTRFLISTRRIESYSWRRSDDLFLECPGVDFADQRLEPVSRYRGGA